jgi:hypothetical protein
MLEMLLLVLLGLLATMVLSCNFLLLLLMCCLHEEPKLQLQL